MFTTYVQLSGIRGRPLGLDLLLLAHFKCPGLKLLLHLEGTLAAHSLQSFLTVAFVDFPCF